MPSGADSIVVDLGGSPTTLYRPAVEGEFIVGWQRTPRGLEEVSVPRVQSERELHTGRTIGLVVLTAVGAVAIYALVKTAEVINCIGSLGTDEECR